MRAKWYLFGCLSSIVILILFIVISISGLVKMTKQQSVVKISDNSVLHLKLSGPMQFYSAISDANFRMFSNTTHDLIQKIRSAKNDSKIKSIILEPTVFEVGYATLNEIMEALNDFKSSGKKIYGYINMAYQTDILLLSVADEVYMNPSASAGYVMLGVGGSIGYYKDMLDKLGVTVRIIRAGDYKSAGENYARSTMSPEFRRNITELYDDIYGQMVNDFSKNYDATTQEVRGVFERNNRLIINQNANIEIKIVDEFMHFDKFLKKINTNENQLVSHTRYRAETPRQHTNRIAVVYALGNITSARAQFGESNITSSQYVKLLDKIEKDNSIKAVVIRVSSPGGSALESEIILDKIAQLRQIKPVVVSMGNIAASGGYYIAANANYIFADPYTITGSIGVIGMIPDLNKAADKIGINTFTVGHGRFLSSNDTWRGYNANIEQAIQLSINETYHEFKTRVSEGRNIRYDDVEKIAQGQVWSAQKALWHGLIDEIGGLQAAINKGASLASIENYSISYFPERKSFIEFFRDDNFDFSLIKMLVKNEMPTNISEPTTELMNLINDIQKDPIQMRSEMMLIGN